jgi:hypothetical protein
MRDAVPRRPANATRRMARCVLGWILAVVLVIGWVLLLHSPGTLPLLFIVAVGVAVAVLVTSIWSAWPHDRGSHLKH